MLFYPESPVVLCSVPYIVSYACLKLKPVYFLRFNRLFAEHGWYIFLLPGTLFHAIFVLSSLCSNALSWKTVFPCGNDSQARSCIKSKWTLVYILRPRQGGTGFAWYFYYQQLRLLNICKGIKARGYWVKSFCLFFVNILHASRLSAKELWLRERERWTKGFLAFVSLLSTERKAKKWERMRNWLGGDIHTGWWCEEVLSVTSLFLQYCIQQTLLISKATNSFPPSHTLCLNTWSLILNKRP